MKTCLLILCLFAAGCVTTTAPDGTTTTRADGKTIKALGRSIGGSALRLYLQSQNIPMSNTLYHQGEVIEGPRQTYDPVHGVNFGVPPGWDGRMDEWEAAGRPPFSPGDIPKDWR